MTADTEALLARLDELTARVEAVAQRLGDVERVLAGDCAEALEVERLLNNVANDLGLPRVDE